MTTTRYQIDESADSGLGIEITGVAGKQEQLLAAFGECQEGQCTCPTDEYRKVEAMEVMATSDRIDIRLKPKPGAQFDPAEITACLDYTIDKTAG